MNSRVSTKILYERRRKPPNSEHTFENLDHFLSDLDGVITRNKEGTSNNLTVFDAVKGMVQKILDVVGTMDPVMKPGRLNPVGSFKEGTKLGNPNEFDFVVEMECFEHSKTLLVKDECNIAGAIHLILSDTTQTTPTQTTMGQLVSEIEHAHGNCKYLSPVRFRNYFWQLVTAVATHLSQQNCTIRNEAGKLEITKDVPQHLDVYDKGPNIEVFMVWTSADETEKFGISVDVTPALRLREVVPEAAGVALNRVQCVQYQDNSGNSVSNVLLIPTINLECKHGELAEYNAKLCWKLSFSILETEIIQNMNAGHKRCLRILKHLKSNQKDGIEQMKELGLDLSDKDPFSATIIRLRHSQGEMSLLTTYRMKMAILEHNEHCKDGQRSPGGCLMEILSLLRQRVYAKFLPIYFIPMKNGWPRGPVGLLESSIDKIISLFQEIMKEVDYSFEKCFDKFAKVQEYVIERDGV